MYLFGGSKRKIIGESSDYHSNELFELNLNSLKWTRSKTAGEGKRPSPRDKTAGWIHENKWERKFFLHPFNYIAIILFIWSIFMNRLFYFGGFGSMVTDQYIGSIKNFSEISNYVIIHLSFYRPVKNKFLNRKNKIKIIFFYFCCCWKFTFVPQKTRRLGWNNQLIHYDLITHTWHFDDNKDLSSVPLPRAAHSCLKVADNRVILFGGRTSQVRCNDLYILDLDTFKWSNK